MIFKLSCKRTRGKVLENFPTFDRDCPDAPVQGGRIHVVFEDFHVGKLRHDRITIKIRLRQRLDNLPAKGAEIVRIARRDHVAVAHHLGVHVFRTGVEDIILDGRKARDSTPLENAR